LFGFPLGNAPIEIGKRHHESTFLGRLEQYWILHDSLLLNPQFLEDRMIGARLDFLARMAGHQGAISLVAASLRFN
jgi:hypothetical protein